MVTAALKQPYMETIHWGLPVTSRNDNAAYLTPPRFPIPKTQTTRPGCYLGKCKTYSEKSSSRCVRDVFRRCTGTTHCDHVLFLNAALEPGIVHVERVKEPSGTRTQLSVPLPQLERFFRGKTLSARLCRAGPQNQAIKIHLPDPSTTTSTNQCPAASYTAAGLSGPGGALCTAGELTSSSNLCRGVAALTAMDS